jgi:hypothetical protein
VFKGFMPEGMREALYEMWAFMRDYGYFGNDMKEQVEWTVQQARGKLTGLEEYLRKVEYTLE